MDFSIEQLLQIIIIDASDLIDVADGIRGDILHGGSITHEGIEYLRDRLANCLSNVDKIQYKKLEEI